MRSKLLWLLDKRSRLELLGLLPAEQVQRTNLAGEGVLAIHAHAPGNGAPLGLKVIAENARFAAHPCGAVSGFDAAASRELGERCAGIGVSSVEQLKEELWIG